MGSLALIGIDGGTWKVIERLIREDYIPNIAELVREGSAGVLKSTIPPCTGPAWLSIATGLSPGQTGVVDFFKHVGNYEFEPVTSADFRDRSFWDYLSLLGYRVAVVDYPLLAPAYPVNGIMISSWFQFNTHPEDLAKKVLEISGGDYNIVIDVTDAKYDSIELFLADIHNILRKKLNVSRWVLGFNYDIYVDVFSFTDWVQHRLWHVIDSSHPKHDPHTASQLWKKITELWQILDSHIGRVADKYENVIIVSDHGFGPHYGVFNPIVWLQKHKLIRLKVNRKKRLMNWIIHLARRFRLGRFVHENIRNRIRREAKILSTRDLYDLARSRVIVPLEYTVGWLGIHVNREAGYSDKVLDEVIRLLHSLEKETKGRVKVSVWRREEIYKGPLLHLLPDLIVAFNDWATVAVKMPSGSVYTPGTYSPRITGMHRIEGIIIAWGELFKKGAKISEARVYDVAPTVLYVFDAPIPSNLDGRPLRVFSVDREPRLVEPGYYEELRVKHELEEALRELSPDA